MFTLWSSNLICKHSANDVNLSRFLHELIRVETWQMLWIYQICYMSHGLNWLKKSILQLIWINKKKNSKQSELIRICKWHMVWIDQDLYMLNGMNISPFWHGMVSIYQDVYMENGLNWSGFLHPNGLNWSGFFT